MRGFDRLRAALYLQEHSGLILYIIYKYIPLPPSLSLGAAESGLNYGIGKWLAPTRVSRTGPGNIDFH